MSPATRRCAGEIDTLALGERLGAALLPGDLLTLTGPLGAGKTVFVRGLAVGAGADPRVVRSPTFVLHHVYRGRRLRLDHIDLYRLGEGADVRFLDIEGLLDEGAVAVEWGELSDLRRFGPARINIDVAADGGRTVQLEAGGPERLRAAFTDETTR